MWAWPRSSLITTRSTPCSRSRVAVEWRRSWKRMRRSPPRSRRPAGAGRARHGRPPGPLSAPPPRGRPATRPRNDSAADDQKREEARTFPHGEGQADAEAAKGIGRCVACRWGRSAPRALPTCSGRGPRRARPGGHSFKFRAGSKPARVRRPAYGPLTMPDPNPNRTPAKAHSAALTRVAV